MTPGERDSGGPVAPYESGFVAPASRAFEHELRALRERLREAEDTLQAIRAGEVDALLIDGPDGPRTYALVTADQSYRMLVEQMRDGALILGRDGVIFYANRAVAELFQVPHASLGGRLFQDLVNADIAARVVALLEGATPVQGVSGEFQHQRGDGSVVPMLLSCSALRTATFDGLCAILTDLSEQKRRASAEDARRAAEEANRLKSEFLANMSHELRTPLNAIQGHLQLIELELHGPVTAAQRVALGRVQRAQQHLLALINDVLHYAKIEASKLEYDVQRVALTEILGDVLPMVEPQIGTGGLRCEVELPADASIAVRADREKLGQVLLNLLSNALKFTPPVRDDGAAPGIVITGGIDARNAAMVCIRVRDNGIGIPPERLTVIFDPFVQVQSALTRRHPGAGLGLAISRELARGMGGDVTVESTLGSGSTFTVAMPRSM